MKVLDTDRWRLLLPHQDPLKLGVDDMSGCDHSAATGHLVGQRGTFESCFAYSPD